MKHLYMIVRIWKGMSLVHNIKETKQYSKLETKQAIKIQGANDIAITNLGELVVVVSDEMYEQAKQAFGTRVVKILM